jgi:hypothetical protein
VIDQVERFSSAPCRPTSMKQCEMSAEGSLIV